MQSIDVIEIYTYGTCKNLVHEKQEIKCKNIIKQCKKWIIFMIQKNIKEQEPNWAQIPDHPCRV